MKKRHGAVREYALYRGDELIGMGTYEELAKITGLTTATLGQIGTPSYYNRLKSSRYENLLFKVVL